MINSADEKEVSEILIGGFGRAILPIALHFTEWMALNAEELHVFSWLSWAVMPPWSKWGVDKWQVIGF